VERKSSQTRHWKSIIPFGFDLERMRDEQRLSYATKGIGVFSRAPFVRTLPRPERDPFLPLSIAPESTVIRLLPLREKLF
jgi:hypothetical protein